MVKRIKIGLIYSYDEGWIAGAYYISNLIHSLNLIEDQVKPELIVLSYSKKEFDSVSALTKYPYLRFKQLYEKDIWGSNYYLVERIVNKMYNIFANKNIIVRNHTHKRLRAQIDFLFPADDHIYFSNVKNKLFWIPDFQEHYLTHLFSEEVIKRRKSYQQKLVDEKQSIVFSSYDALAHFKEIYPNSRSKTFVLQFAVTHSSYEQIDIVALKDKFKIEQSYLFCPNQFWAHKNHLTVLKAVNYLKEKGKTNVLIVFSGKESDPRNPDYFGNLKKYVEENKIEKQIRFLGFIDRSEQLQLMKNAISVVQPSQFEGWSTSVEDAKAMNQYVIASNLPIHIEQLTQNVSFFDPLDYIKLAEIIENFYSQAPLKAKINYTVQKEKFGKTFINIIEQI
jgi:glycosyltransferase involved in cell wall biosynthesis